MASPLGTDRDAELVDATMGWGKTVASPLGTDSDAELVDAKCRASHSRLPPYSLACQQAVGCTRRRHRRVHRRATEGGPAQQSTSALPGVIRVKETQQSSHRVKRRQRRHRMCGLVVSTSAMLVVCIAQARRHCRLLTLPFPYPRGAAPSPRHAPFLPFPSHQQAAPPP